MFHLIHGYLQYHDDRCFIDNGLFGLEVIYEGTQQEGTFFLASLFDQQGQTFRFYAFESIVQKRRFEDFLKIQGVGGKSAYQLATLPEQDLADALERMDVQYFQRLPGIGPKTAKRLLVELKTHFTQADLQKLAVDKQVYDDITHSLRGLGYQSADIKKLLFEQPYPCTQEHLPDIMKRLIERL